ncbi:aspartate aminotransferase, mitochondrial-like [Ipomoea triloba]|uniref:aspartate aminotransferase, mitochondrial-like n=1 Tax=Ipomoea triloba TaxID=35885 RepID=UPI00125D6C57|nr:aspartate aminotransferase, mitochondrial-like [Ipomoea triloba]
MIFKSSTVVGAQSMSLWWQSVDPTPKDPILGITQAFLVDLSPNKVNVGVGAYRDDNGKPVVLECVREAERRIAGGFNMEYLQIGGSVNMIEESLNMDYKENYDLIKDKHIGAIQSLSRMDACRNFTNFQKHFCPDSQILIHVPTWSNHHSIWRGAHNPTGVDPTEEQWKEISHQLKVKGHFAFFDTAYQGFASGNTKKDARAIQIFIEDGHQVGCSQSYAKNMGLYGQRVGCLSMVRQEFFGVLQYVDSQSTPSTMN